MGPEVSSLAGRVYATALAALGAGERLQVAGLVRDAHKVMVDADAVESLSAAISDMPWAFECNLDTIFPPAGPVWYEWEASGGFEGFLVAPTPGQLESIVFIHCRDSGNNAVHPNAVAAFNLERLYEHAWWARTRFSTARDESLERMMGCVVASVPDGFASELEVLEAGPEADEREMRAATAAFPLLLSIMVAHAGEGWLSSRWVQGTEQLSLAARRRKGPMRRLVDLAVPRTHTAFTRRVEDGRAHAVWYRPA